MDHHVNNFYQAEPDHDQTGYTQDDPTYGIDPSLVDDGQGWMQHSNQFGQSDFTQQAYDPYPVDPHAGNISQYQPQHTFGAQYSPYGGIYHPPLAQNPYGATSEQYMNSPYSSVNQFMPTASNQHFTYPAPTPDNRTVTPSALQVESTALGQQDDGLHASNHHYPDPTQLGGVAGVQHYQDTGYEDNHQSGTRISTSSHQTPSKHNSIPDQDTPSASTSHGYPQLQSAQSSDTFTPLCAPIKAITRITDQNLKARREADAASGRSIQIPACPFLHIDDQTILLTIGGKSDIPKYKPRTNRSGRPLLPGLDQAQLEAAAEESNARQLARLRSTARRPRQSTRPPVSRDPRVRVADNTSAGSPSTVSVSSGEEHPTPRGDDEDAEGSDEEMGEQLVNVRSAVRPTAPAAAVAWDVTGVMWQDRLGPATREHIVKAIPEFQQIIADLREDLKGIAADLTKAETAKQYANVEAILVRRDTKREIFAEAVKAAINTGHPQILEHLSESQRLVSLLAGALIDCAKLDDHTGELPRAILKLMSLFKTLDDSILEKVKFDNIAKRFSKKGDDEIKDYVSKILASTPQAKERVRKEKEDVVKNDKIKKGLALQEKLRARKVDERKIEDVSKLKNGTAGTKRPRTEEVVNGNPAKKLASGAAAAAPSAVKAPPVTVKPVIAKPANFFANLKRPSTKSSAAAAAAAAATTKPAPSIVPVKKQEEKPVITAPAQSQPSSLAALLASIEEPKVVKQEQPKEKPPPLLETPEQTAKRQRKESRRHLRVRWKEASDLEEIRLFKHDQAEDEGRQDAMLRDAHDVGSEGLRLKEGFVGDLPMDDEEDAFGETRLRPYGDMISVNFDTLDEEKRRTNMKSRGGLTPIRTRQQEEQEKREMLELMVVYTDPSDVPASPKEPPSQTKSIDLGPEKVLDTDEKEPKDWLKGRLQDITEHGPQYALAKFVRRAQDEVTLETYKASQNIDTAQAETRNDFSSTTRQSNQSTTFAPVQPDTLIMPNMSHIPTASQGPQPHPVQELSKEQGPHGYSPAGAWEALKLLVEQYKNKPYPAIEPPEWMGEKGKQGWWEGYYRDHPEAKAAKDLQDRKVAIAAEAQARLELHNQQQASQQMSIHEPAQLPGYPAIPPGMDPQQFAGLFAGYNGTQSSTLPTQTPYWNGQWPVQQAAGQYYDLPLQVGQQPIWDGSKWVYSTAQHTQEAAYKPDEHGQGWDNDNETAAQRADRFRTEDVEGKDYKGKRKPCKFWNEGKCSKGQKCGYLHDGA